MIYDEDPFRRRQGKSTVRYKTMGEVHLDGGKIDRMGIQNAVKSSKSKVPGGWRKSFI